MAKARLFISTDMQMITGVNERDGDKDDVQSLVHALLYQDKLDIVGIASSTSQHQPGANNAKFIHHVIDEYARDYAKLEGRGKPGDFKTADELHDITYQGTKSLAGKSGYPSATDASKAIIKEAREAEAAGDVLYVATWGGMGDVARALHDAPDIAGSIRLISASGPKQEANAYKYVKENFAGDGEFWWIDAQTTQRGIYAQENKRLNPEVTLSEVEKIAKGHGNLGDLFYENAIDVRGKGDTYDGLKMSDSHTVLYLIDNASNDNPTASSWGGKYRKVDDNYWADRTDSASALGFDGGAGARTTYQHRDAWLNDFAKRLDWLKDGASKPPADTTSPADVKPPPAEPPADATPPKAGTGDLVVRVSGDHYKGAPQFEVTVDGVKAGTYTAKADHRKGEWQDVVIDGDWADGVDHKVEVKFLNNLYGGSSADDRNLWVESVSMNGVTTGKETYLDKTGSKVTWTLHDTPGKAPAPKPAPAEQPDNSALDTITVTASGKHYQGSPNFVLTVDGDTIDFSNVVTADYNKGEWQTFTFTGDFGSGSRVGIEFDNDRYGGSSSKDRNLYIDEVTFNGEVNGQDVKLTSNGTSYWDF